MTCLVLWILAGSLLGLLWAWLSRERDRAPNQWQRYRGVMHLREHVDAHPAIDTAHLTLHLRSSGHEGHQRYALAEPLRCSGCQRATMIVHRGTDGGVRCPSC